MQLEDNGHCAIVRNLYYLGPDRKERMDVYLPGSAEEEAYPCIIIYHTDGRESRRTRELEADMALYLAARGYVILLAETSAALRNLAGWNEELVVPGWPNNLYECKSAVRYARKWADTYRIDPARIGVIGGHLALLTAFTANHAVMNQGGLYQEYSSEVSCAIDVYGIEDFLTWSYPSYQGFPLAMMARNLPTAHEGYDAFPIEGGPKQGNDVPPLLIVHGALTGESGLALSPDFIEQLKATDLAWQFVAAGSATDREQSSIQVDLRQMIVQFLDRILKASG
ncbi:hypothetical protein GCM10023310_42810 [Paenibacillus vulneris]|uniref:BD-FAE-like domain-containing protein n=1 Tax=Paenibacillus vulneris TaxID=1133364 RepID=A0ABW3UTM4_9BACL